MTNFKKTRNTEGTMTKYIAQAIEDTKTTSSNHCIQPRKRVDDIADQINQRLGIDKPSIVSAILDATSKLDELRIEALLADSKDTENPALISVNFAQLIADQLEKSIIEAA